MFAVAFIASFLATLSLALSGGSPMHLCPWNGVADASNFTLLAVFKTDASIQKPLALRSGDLGHSSFASLGSAESIYSILAKNFVLADGGVTAYASDGTAVAVSYQVPSENGLLSFIRTDLSYGQPVSPAKVYCMLFNTDPEGARYPDELAVNGGDSDHFSLCQRSTLGNDSVVIYNASESTSDHWETCEDIYVYIRIFPS